LTDEESKNDNYDYVLGLTRDKREEVSEVVVEEEEDCEASLALLGRAVKWDCCGRGGSGGRCRGGGLGG
jgi:hypothetical protein